MGARKTVKVNSDYGIQYKAQRMRQSSAVYTENCPGIFFSNQTLETRSVFLAKVGDSEVTLLSYTNF